MIVQDKNAIKYVLFLLIVIAILVYLIYGRKKVEKKPIESGYSVWDSEGWVLLAPGT